ncbi:hypothetical protein UlMin_035206 [Ulmus minor]
MGRSPCCDEDGLKKGPWTPEEDQKLVQFIQQNGHGSWRALPKLAGLNRCGKSCRLRWTNYLRPDIKRGKFSQEEEQTILHLHSILGNKWSAIATHLPGRTDNEIKNFWNTHLKKKLIQMGFDPMTHQPRTDLFSNLHHLMALANLRDLLEQYQPLDNGHSRLQADAVQLARLQYLNSLLQCQSTPASSSSTNTNGFINIDSSLLPLNENPILNMSKIVENPGSFCPQPLHHTTFTSLPHLSPNNIDPQVPFTSRLSLESSNNEMMVSQRDHNNPPAEPDDSSWFLPNLIDHELTSLCNNVPGDASSTTSSYGAGGVGSSSYWPDQLFLEDYSNIMHEIS